LKLTVPVALFALAAPASAQYLDSPFKYNYLELNYASTSLDAFDPRLDGYGGRLSVAAEKAVRLVLQYDDMEGSEAGVDHRRMEIQAGVGFMSSPADSVDMILDLKYLRGEQERGDDNVTKHGYGIELGTRSLLHPLVELDVSGEWREWYRSEFGARAAVRFLVTENFSVGARFAWFETQELLTAGLRFSL
jgi:hypothetical protein